MKKWAIALHGGAGAITKQVDQSVRHQYVEGLRHALQVGVDLLKSGSSAMTASVAVVKALEENPLFNSGKGAVFNYDGKHELDASVMDGATLKCGAVAGCTTVRNPIELARLVMERTSHILLIANGAESFATEMNVERVSNDWFSTEKRKQQLHESRKDDSTRITPGELVEQEKPPTAADPMTDKKHGTVGCACLDVHGNLAAATSTGGLTNKRWGRVGDSPIIGAGTYANNATAAMSATGHGEQFIRHCVCHAISAAMEHTNMSFEQAASKIVHGKLQKGDGGVVGVSHTGDIAMVFNSAGMFRAAADSAGRFEVAIWEEQTLLV